MNLLVPIRTKSILNLREHHLARAKRNKKQRGDVAQLWPWQYKRRAWRWPVTVLLTRRAPSTLDDDNLRAALKAVRDEVAKQLGADDGDRTRLRFEYAEEVGTYAVLISVRESEA